MKTVLHGLWWAVLLSCRAFHALAADHTSIDRPYKRLAIGNSTAAATTTEHKSLPHSRVTISSISSTTRTKQDALPPSTSPATASNINSSLSVHPSLEGGSGGSVTTSTSKGDGKFPATGAQNSDARAFRDGFIASITTFTRPSLTAPPTSTRESNWTFLTSPTFSPNTTNNITTTTGWYTNSSTASLPTSASASEVPSSEVSPTTTEDLCTPTSEYGSFTTVIEYSIVYTWTITWLGNPADYTPPYPTISTPRPCTPTTSATGRFTVSMCDSSGQSCSFVHTTAEPAAPGLTDPWWVWITDSSIIRGLEPTLTFITTDKNPAVVFPTSSPPDYGGSADPMGNVHSAAYPDDAQPPDAPDYGNGASTNQNVRSRPIATDPPPVTVIVKPSLVVIDDQTFTNNPAQPTSTVVVGGNTFTINPTQVVGAGATVSRPPTQETTVSPWSTKTTIDQIGVDVEGSSVIIDKTTFTIGPRPTTVTIQGQPITVGPGVIVFPDKTLTIPAPPITSQVVVGAEIVTAVGSDRAVIEGRTITYGPGSGTTVTEVVDGETIFIGPLGIIAHGETYGGVGAASTEVQLAVVGGVTISQIGSSLVVVQGVTYTLDALAPQQAQTRTTVLLSNGETITIGPEGVAIATWTLDSPYVSTTVLSPGRGAAAAATLPSATAINTNKENGGSSLVSTWPNWVVATWIATGATIVGARLL